MNTAFHAQRPLLGNACLTSSSNHDLIHQYLSWKKSYTRVAYKVYRIWIVRFQEFVNKPPEDLTHLDYGAFAESLRERYASCGIQFALTVIHNYLRFFAEQGRLGFPIYLARVPKGIANSHQAITEEDHRKIVDILQTRTFWQSCFPLRDLLIVMLLHDTGMRIGELMSLEVDDIEEDRSAVIHTEKTIRKRRVFWNADTDEVLQRYLVERINHGPADTDRDPLFIKSKSRSGKALTRRSAERMFQRALSCAGIAEKLSPHSYRHAFIHRLARLSVPDAIIAQLVGHSTPMTIAHYTKLSRPEFEHYARIQLGSGDHAVKNTKQSGVKMTYPHR